MGDGKLSGRRTVAIIDCDPWVFEGEKGGEEEAEKNMARNEGGREN